MASTATQPELRGWSPGALQLTRLSLRNVVPSILHHVVDSTSLCELELELPSLHLPRLLPGQLPGLTRLALRFSLPLAEEAGQERPGSDRNGLPGSWCLGTLRELVLECTHRLALWSEIALTQEGLRRCSSLALLELRTPALGLPKAERPAQLDALRELTIPAGLLSRGPDLAGLTRLVLIAPFQLPPRLGQATSLRELACEGDPELRYHEPAALHMDWARDSPALLGMAHLRLLDVGLLHAGGPDTASIHCLLKLARRRPRLEIRVRHASGRHWEAVVLSSDSEDD